MQVSKSYKILVVEDEGLIAHDISRRLETLGHTVLPTVSTADEAIERASEADLVLMDIHIDGDRDGIEAAKEIRERYHIPVIFLTAHADRATLERAKLAAPYGYIVKPLGPASLQASIEIGIYKHSMERRLEEREAWLRTTLSSAAEAILAADTGGRVLLMNPAAENLSGWRQSEAQGQPLTAVLRLFHNAEERDAADLAVLAILQDAPLTLERGLHLKARNGRDVQVEGSVAPVRVVAGTVGVVLTLHDVTARRWQERHLRQAQRMETAGRLASSVAADYANLLAVIGNQANLLAAQFGDYAPARRSLDEIQQAVTEAGQITGRLASFGVRQSGRPETVSLNSVVRRLSKLIQSAAADKVALTIQPQSGAGYILADVAHLEQAMMTLILHACEATPRGGALSVETSNLQTGVALVPTHGERFAVLRIWYSATEPDAERMFDPAEPGESGFALAVAQSIVAEHGGILSAREWNGGSEIQMLLPVAERPAEAVAEPGRPRAARTVLLVEPRERVRSHLHNVVEAAGFNLLEASDAQEAAALCEVQEAPLDVLIVPDQDAATTLAGLGEAHMPRHVLRLVETPANAIDQLQRPFTQHALLAKIYALTGAEPAAAQATGSG
jgi:PAS domain S-box-containing protein